MGGSSPAKSEADNALTALPQTVLNIFSINWKKFVSSQPLVSGGYERYEPENANYPRFDVCLSKGMAIRVRE
jgi:hypothetical protein